MKKSRFKFIILALCVLPLPSMAAESVSKTNAYVVTSASPGKVSASKTNTYVVTGASPGKISASKLNSYIVTGTSPGKSFVSKVNAFVVTGIASSKLQVSKMTTYVVLGPQPVTKQPNIFITAMREPRESPFGTLCDSKGFAESLTGNGRCIGPLLSPEP